MGQARERVLLSGDHLTVLGFTFGADSISAKVTGFSPFMGSLKKTSVHCLLCLIVVLVILLVKDPKRMLA